MGKAENEGAKNERERAYTLRHPRGFAHLSAPPSQLAHKEAVARRYSVDQQRNDPPFGMAFVNLDGILFHAKYPISPI